jgi:glucoamylase
VKLRRSIRDGKIFDQPPQPYKRYVIDKHGRQHWGWRLNNKTRTVPRHQTLRLNLLSPALVHWSLDGWKTTHDSETHDTGVGIHILNLPTASLPPRSQVVFTFFWTEENRWEGKDYTVSVE